ncbi:hypothetical protein ElyMa_000689900 [Elysia marginata]|uniref:Uncharacterized protein n=1 Tax=Elysia marginata TaxID=1093978 RepID=A0AAV4GJJ6_9GAST|nr:hypothetical protein ElyMa_000689900 [Elysia marginata]
MLGLKLSGIMQFTLLLLLLVKVTVNTNQCDLSPRLDPLVGEVNGTTCTTWSSDDVTIAHCVLQCHILADCRVAYQSCEGRSCHCVLCRGVDAIDFARLDKQFYLKGTEVAADVTFPPDLNWDLPGGGLSVGRVIRVRVVLPKERLDLVLSDSHSNNAFVIRMNMFTKGIRRNSKINECL